MKNNPQPSDSFERSFHRALRALPDRTAPAALQSRVMSEIARRAALPWYRQSFARWPLAARTVFLIVSAAGAAFLIFVLAQIFNLIPSHVETPAAFTYVSDMWHSVSAFCARTLSGIPSTLLMLVSVGIAACYMALFGFGAAAYRYLWKIE